MRKELRSSSAGQERGSLMRPESGCLLCVEAEASWEGRNWTRRVLHCCWMVWCVVSVVVVVAATLTVREAVAVLTCPEECLCLSDSKVICNGGRLTSVPEKLQETVEDLSLSKNLLPGLTTDMFRRWRHLKVLHLNDNQIMDIKPFAFRGLAHLKEISIQNNPLAELPRFSFAGLENVNQINLCKNRITTIHPYVFAGSRNIGMILLQENPITRVMARAFSGLRTAQFLYLPSWVKVIESDAFYDLEGVGLLRLHSLDLHALRPHTFRGLRNVTQISIQESDLGMFRDLAFDGLQNVGELRILNNKVDMLESLEVREESNVDTVIVQGNHFLQVSQEKPLRIHANVRSVVTGNYLPCSCQLWWVLESPLALNTPLFSRHNFCVSPYPLHGKDITYVDMDKLERCPAPQELQQPSGQETSQGAPTLPLPDFLSAVCVSLLLLFRPDW